jgi:hypothetical protein
MEQFYFLSIVANTLAGLVLASEHLGKKISFFELIDRFFKHSGVRIVLAFLVMVIGLIKLIWPFQGIPILGDLLPAAAGLGGGFTLLFDFMRNKSDVKSDTLGKMDKIFLNNKFLIGIGSILTAVLHFFLNFIVFF